MATVAVLAETKAIAKGVYLTEGDWSTTATGHGSVLNAPMLSNKTLQVLYPTGGTSRFVLEGSNVSFVPVTDTGATEWYTLTNVTGGSISATIGATNAGNFNVIRENPRFIRPRVSTVTGAIKIRIISSR